MFPGKPQEQPVFLFPFLKNGGSELATRIFNKDVWSQFQLLHEFRESVCLGVSEWRHDCPKRFVHAPYRIYADFPALFW